MLDMGYYWLSFLDTLFENQFVEGNKDLYQSVQLFQNVIVALELDLVKWKIFFELYPTFSLFQLYCPILYH